MKFCRFTEAAPDDPPVLVNPDHVRAVRPHSGNSEIVFDAEHTIIVTEAPDVVVAKLEAPRVGGDLI
jgi:hypothetical protein